MESCRTGCYCQEYGIDARRSGLRGIIMELQFLGFGAAYYPVFGNTAAYFTWQQDFYLIDCGEDVFGKIYQLPEYWNASRIFVILTHMHSDHVGSLGSLISYTEHFYQKQVVVLYPDGALQQYLKLSGIGKEHYRQITDGVQEEGILIEPVPVYHDPSMGCYGYFITAGEKRIYYSGDSQVIATDIVHQLLEGKLYRLYVDTAKHAPVSSGHGNYEALKARIPMEYRGQVTCMHLDCDFRKEILAEGFRVC